MRVKSYYWNCGQVRIKCNEDDTIGDLKKLIAAQTGTKYDLFYAFNFVFLHFCIIAAPSMNCSVFLERFD